VKNISGVAVCSHFNRGTWGLSEDEETKLDGHWTFQDQNTGHG